MVLGSSNTMNIEIRRSNRKTMALEVTADAKVIVRAPFWMPYAEIERFVHSKRAWIAKSLEKRASQPRRSNKEIERLAIQAKEVLPQKVAFYAGKMGVSYGRITIRNQKTRWGSCSSKGNLNFNCLLMLTPEEVQDYVVVHELCHRKEMNHSANFWKEVEKILPDYKERRKWLKEHGREII